MKLIGITSEHAVADEATRIVEALKAGFDYFHLRKPHYADEEMRRLIDSIPAEYHHQLTLGSNQHLISEYGIGGIHIKCSCATIKSTIPFNARTSKSCHSIEEVAQCCDEYNYVFLSPIFDSVSKIGYSSNFTSEQLKSYSEKGLLKHVVALGGVTADNLQTLMQYNLYGTAILGYLFSEMSITEYKERLHDIISIIK
ncbi:MAG: thiamine phosphate synthase [Bacteroidales bacterium]|nr:thiamine phosphate synthase [Bacteroidales bacterium]